MPEATSDPWTERSEAGRSQPPGNPVEARVSLLQRAPLGAGVDPRSRFTGMSYAFPAAAARANWSANSFPTLPLCPRTHSQVTSCGARRASTRCQSRTCARLPLPAPLHRPWRQRGSLSIPRHTYSESVTRWIRDGSLRASRARATAGGPRVLGETTRCRTHRRDRPSRRHFSTAIAA